MALPSCGIQSEEREIEKILSKLLINYNSEKFYEREVQEARGFRKIDVPHRLIIWYAFKQIKKPIHSPSI